MQAKDTGLTPLRIANGNWTLFVFMGAFVMVFGGALAAASGGRSSILLPVSVLMMAWFAYILIRVRPYWIEVSNQFSYRTLAGVTRVDWVDVKSMHFEFRSEDYQSRRGVKHRSYYTNLVIILPADQRLIIHLSGRFGSAAHCLEAITQTFAAGFSATQPQIRQSAIEGLSRFGSSCTYNLVHVAKREEDFHVRADGTKAIKTLQSLVEVKWTGNDFGFGIGERLHQDVSIANTVIGAHRGRPVFGIDIKIDTHFEIDADPRHGCSIVTAKADAPSAELWQS